ncbi:TPA: hypothetical protein N5H07_005466 [Salmonella enterica subsp. enterica serovar Paratyphi B]|nr:hypothetical protein [Salmonella enterica subsp. enterica serovar Paratyphi B]
MDIRPFSSPDSQITGLSPDGKLRILKCYLANSSNGHFVTSREVTGTGDTLTCASCGCPVVLRTGAPGEEPWFEHDQQTVELSVLLRCTHLDPEVKTEIRRRQLETMVDGLAHPVMVRSWVCVWCGCHYRGAKFCRTCGTGIYSTELANRQASVNEKENYHALSDDHQPCR